MSWWTDLFGEPKCDPAPKSNQLFEVAVVNDKRKRFKELENGDETINLLSNLADGWYTDDDGEHYIKVDSFRLVKEFKKFRFLDWCIVEKMMVTVFNGLTHDSKFVSELVNVNLETLESCENPRKEYWKHFLELEMKEKHERDIKMKAWVDSVLVKKIEYDDINLKYNNLPAAPIVDVGSFRNFCKLVGESAKYEDYEVSNYLMLIRGGGMN